MLISVHLPKTAGESFRAALETAYGTDQVTLDYDDRPLNASRLSRRATAIRQALSLRMSGVHETCIHGHFLPIKYRLATNRENVQFITWLRDPVERIASHYYYWKSNPLGANAPPLRRRVEEEQWSLEKFCLSYELRNLYSEFLWGMPLARFTYIGITEHYAEDLNWLGREVLEVNLERHHLNQGTSGERHITDSALRQRVEDWHSADMQLYKAALRQRDTRS